MNVFWKGFAWGFAIFGVTSALAWNAARVEPPKVAAVAAPVAASASDEALYELEQAVRSNPDDVELRLKLANEYFIRKNVVGMSEQTRYILAKNPNDPRALTYQAFAHISNGEAEAADVLLHRAVTADPDFLDAWVAIAFLKAQGGKMDEAEAALSEAKRRHPEETARLEEIGAEMRK